MCPHSNPYNAVGFEIVCVYIHNADETIDVNLPCDSDDYGYS